MNQQAIWKRCLAIFDNNNVIGVHLITLYSFLFYVNDTKVLSFSQTAMDLLNYFPFFFALSLQNNGKMMCEFSRKVLSLHLPIKNLTPKYVLITGTPGDYGAKIGIKNELCK